MYEVPAVFLVENGEEIPRYLASLPTSSSLPDLPFVSGASIVGTKLADCSFRGRGDVGHRP